MEIKVNLKENSYSVYIDRDILSSLRNYYSLDRKVLIITDNNIPKAYYDEVLKDCLEGYTYVIEAGEKSKNITNYCLINKFLLDNKFSRDDLIIALGGGVVGDLGAFVASTYKRGIDFINIPTSSLAMIDSSVGGKTAIDFNGVKNSIGTFYQPKLVLIDLNTLNTLDERNLNNGLIEALKMGFILDPSIIDLFDDYKNNLEEIIIRSLQAKIKVVELDEKESNYRKILNFGHTLGHAFESYVGSNELLHGEAVGLGMYYVLNNDLKDLVKKYLIKLNIDINKTYHSKIIMNLIRNDKKANIDTLDLIVVEELGKAIIKKVTYNEIEELLKEGER